MGKVEKSIEKPTSERLGEVLTQLSTDQIRFVIARQDVSTDKEAAEGIGIKPNTVYNWPAVVKEATQLMAADGLVVAQHIRSHNVAKAMQVKVAGLNSDDERVRQGVATEVIEWEMGKATLRQVITGADGEPIVLQVKGFDEV